MADLDPAQFDFTGTDSNLTITKKQIQCKSNSFTFLTFIQKSMHPSSNAMLVLPITSDIVFSQFEVQNC